MTGLLLAIIGIGALVIGIFTPFNVKAAEDRISNHSFENGLDHWNVDEKSKASIVVEEGFNGDFALRHESNKAYQTTTSQTISDLEDGYYTLSVMTKSSGGQKASYIFADTADKSRAMTSLPATDDWTKTIIRGVEVTNGQLTIGLHSDGEADTWAMADEFKLEKTDDSYRLLKGGDVSELTHVESKDGQFNDFNDVEKDVFQIFKENGQDIVRLRVFNDPGKGRGDGEWYRQEGFLNKEDILDLAKRANSAGLQIQLTFHYSDYWTNGSVQNIPNEWQEEIDGLSEEETTEKLSELIYDYTKEVMEEMKEQGTSPEYVSLGNEMQSGILFPYGQATNENWGNLASLLNAGANAVNEVDPSSKVILHLDGAGEYDKYNDFFDHAEQHEVRYDIIGSSYYPFWSRIDVEEVIDFYNDISEKYKKDIVVMETGFNWNPTLPNGYPGQLTDNGPYSLDESTPEGQKNFLNELFNGLKRVNDGRVIGVLYWDPIMIDRPDLGWAVKESDDEVGENVVSNTTLFDFEGKALEALESYKYNSEGTHVGHINGAVKGTNGNTIPYAHVSVTIDGDEYTTKADRNGNYLLPDLPLGTDLHVSAEKPGYTGNSATVESLIAGEFSNLNIELTGGAVSGHVEDDSGKPVEKASVSVKVDDIEYSTLTDELGNYLLGDLPEGNNYSLNVSKQGYEGDVQEGVDVSIGGETSEVDFIVTLNSGSITGRVLDIHNNPIKGATVSVDDNGAKLQTKTDQSGEYTLEYVTNGENYTVVSSKETFLDGEVTGVNVVTGEITQISDIIIQSNVGVMSGTVKDSKGNPVSSEAVVTLASGVNFYRAEVDSSGAFHFEDVTAGDYKVTAEKEGYVAGVEPSVIVEAEKVTSDVNLRIGDPIEVPNHSFENPGEDWMISNESVTSMIHHPSVLDGELVLSSWADTPYKSDVYQTITDLEDGHYTVTAHVYTGGGQNEFYMYAKDGGVDEVQAKIPATGSMVPITLNTKVSEGQLTIGFYTDAKSGNWSIIDGVQLGYRGNIESGDSLK